MDARDVYKRQEQDEFEVALTNVEHRITNVEKNSRKMEDLLTKSSQMYEKKMKSLKEFILEKIKNSGEKVQVLSMPLQQGDR